MEKNLVERLLENIISKTFITVLGLIGTVIGIYAFFQEQKSELRYEITSYTNVLDFNADLNKLEVYYDSTNLKLTNENLIIYTLRVINRGNKDILKTHFDENDPIGISINSGKIIEKPQVILSSSNYIKKNLSIINYDKQMITFSQVILEPNEFFTIKLLILHKKGQNPKIGSIGKIAGQKDISVVNPNETKNDASFFDKAFIGNFWIQISRLIVYFIIAILIIALIVITSIQIESYKEKRKKKELVSEFKKQANYEYSRIDDALFDRFNKDDGIRVLRRMFFLTKKEEELNKRYKKLKEGFKTKEYRLFRRTDDAEFEVYNRTDDWTIINFMLTDGLIFKENEDLIINQGMRFSLSKFINFLREKGELRSSHSNKVIHRAESGLIEDKE